MLTEGKGARLRSRRGASPTRLGCDSSGSGLGRSTPVHPWPGQASPAAAAFAARPRGHVGGRAHRSVRIAGERRSARPRHRSPGGHPPSSSTGRASVRATPGAHAEGALLSARILGGVRRSRRSRHPRRVSGGLASSGAPGVRGESRHARAAGGGERKRERARRTRDPRTFAAGVEALGSAQRGNVATGAHRRRALRQCQKLSERWDDGAPRSHRSSRRRNAISRRDRGAAGGAAVAPAPGARRGRRIPEARGIDVSALETFAWSGRPIATLPCSSTICALASRRSSSSRRSRLAARTFPFSLGTC